MNNDKIYDVIVCGAGAAGLPAALAAYRQGLKVALIEEDSHIGGAAVDYNILHFCGIPYHGIFEELYNTMIEIAPEMKLYNCFRKGAFQLAWQKLFKDTDIGIFTGEKVCDVIMESNKIKAVKTQSNTYEGKIFIDGTGDGIIADKSGCEMRYGREAATEYNERFAPKAQDEFVQMCTMMYSVTRTPDNKTKDKAEWAMLDDDEFLIWGPTLHCDTRIPEEVQKATNKAMKMLEKDADAWLEKGFCISEIAPKIGVRESRRLVGEYVLTLNDLLSKQHYDDSICIAQYPIDPWEPEGNPFHDYEHQDRCTVPFYEIPYRTLVTKKVDNLIVTGRCMSASHVANSSLRVMGIAMMTGQAAGVASKLAIDNNVATYAIDGKKLSEILRSQGVKTTLEE